MSISEISLYNILRKKLGDQETAELVEFVKDEVESGINNKTAVLMTKDDQIELIERINDTKAELMHRINDTRGELIDRIGKAKNETIIWIVGIGVLQFILSILSKKFL
jgi:hypothetical protein